jgi:hypothetical protein
VPQYISPTLNCYKSGVKMQCNWTNCELKTGEESSKINIAKSPDYIKTETINQKDGSTSFYMPDEQSGRYYIQMSCQNGENLIVVAV